MLKTVDPTFTINSERDFQARNARAYEVELLVAPSRAETLSDRDQPRPIPLEEQEWLLLGRPVDQVVGCRDGSPARIVARSEEHTSELQSLMRISYAVFCLKKKTTRTTQHT